MDSISRLARKALPKGFRLDKTSSGHWRILTPNGDYLRAPNGVPIKISCSPSDHHWVTNLRKDIDKALKKRVG